MDGADRLAAAVIAVFGLAQLLVVMEAWNHPLIWDSSVYTAMGKWIFSLGEIGFWENFRPPVLPAILGFLWKLGVPEIGFFRLLSVGVSVLGIGAVYYLSRDLLDGKVAVLAAAIMASSYTYFRFSLEPLTDILASLLVFTGLYLVHREKPLHAGSVLGLAFLTRFPAALAGPAAVAYILVKSYSLDDIWKGIYDSAKVSVGFFALAGVYLAAQYWFFGGILTPFQTGISIPAGAGSDHFFGLTYLLKAGKSSPLLLLAPLGLYGIFRKREWGYGSFAAALVVFYIFFSSFPLKIERYLLLFLPMMALLAARGFLESLRYLPEWENWTEIVLIAAFGILVFNAAQTHDAYNWESPEQQQFFSNVSSLEGVVASNDPRVTLYGDFRYRPLPPGELSKVIDRYGETIDHWAVNGNSWDCRGYENCRTEIDNLQGYLEENYVVSSKILADSYNYTIYSRG